MCGCKSRTLRPNWNTDKVGSMDENCNTLGQSESILQGQGKPKACHRSTLGDVYKSDQSVCQPLIFMFLTHTQLLNHSDWSLNLNEAHLTVLFLARERFQPVFCASFASPRSLFAGWVARGVWGKTSHCGDPNSFMIIWLQLLFKLERRGHHFRTLWFILIYDSSQHLPKLMEHSINILSNSRIASGSSRGC